MVIAKLNSTLFWDELTVRDISNLVVFSDSDMPYYAETMMRGDSNLIQPQNEVI